MAAGFSNNGSNDDFALVRYNTGGSLDTSFDTDGKVTTAIGSSNDYALSIAIQSDGKIVAGGSSNNGSNDDFAIIRYGVSSVVVLVDSVAQAKAAAAQREAEKMVAREDMVSTLKNAKDFTVDLFARAQIPGITSQNIVAVQAELIALPEKSRGDIRQILRIARKYEVVGMIASDRVAAVYSGSLIEIGLIPVGSKHKAALTAVIKKLPASERSSYAAIKAAIDAELAEIQARNNRSKIVLVRIASHRTY